MVRTAIVTGALAVEPADPIASYAQGIVTRLNQFWGDARKTETLTRSVAHQLLAEPSHWCINNNAAIGTVRATM
jgi:hypothetical protein